MKGTNRRASKKGSRVTEALSKAQRAKLDKGAEAIEEFEKLLLACAPPNETGPFAERAAVRNRAILWLLYDTGIRVSELINLRVRDVDRKHGVIMVLGKGARERRVALGQNCLRNLSYYLDKHRPDEAELSEWGSDKPDILMAKSIVR